MEDLFIAYENIKFSDSAEFKDSDRLQSIYKNFRSSINKYHNSKHEICFYLNQLKELFDKYDDKITINCNCNRLDGLYGDYTFAQFCSSFFKANMSTIYKYIKVYKTFLEKYNQFREFDVSKLMELLSIDIKILIKDVEAKELIPSMTKIQIRNYVKIKSGAGATLEDEEINEEDIPKAYDPSLHYEDKYFMSLAKSQLVNNIISLQEYCEKLQEKIKELKKKRMV